MIQYFPKISQVAEWPNLQTGDIVDIVAPAWKCRPDELRGAVKFLKSLGLSPRFDKKIFDQKVKDFAQTDEERFRQLSAALLSSESKVVWCVRGGYGSLRLLADLDLLKPPKKSKILVGYSDITTLHQFLNGKWKWPTIHGPLLDRFGRGANLPRETRETLSLVFGRGQNLEFKNLIPLNSAAKNQNVIRSSVIGGNLAVIQSSLGTPWSFFPNGHIVFFEDIGERPHRLDRMLTQLRLNGYFNRAKAVIFGSLLISDLKDRRGISDLVLPRFAKEVSIPVLTGMPCGHGKVQRPLPFLKFTQLNTGSAPSLIVKGQ